MEGTGEMAGVVLVSRPVAKQTVDTVLNTKIILKNLHICISV
jgi:hypothetical protein